jgi:DNA-binding CsgD family transcriptional regulator
MAMADTFEFRQAQRVDLAQVWDSLIHGREVVDDCFFTETRCGLVLGPPLRAEATVGFGLVGRERLVVESMLRGVCQNTIAIDLSVAPSTVALRAKRGLGQLGVCTSPSRAHPLLMLAARAARRPPLPCFVAEESRSDPPWRAIVMPRPELCLKHGLSRAQFEAVALLVEGRTYADIAERRGTAPRTTANQLATAFRALQVSGRSQLSHRLFVLSGWVPHPSYGDST